MNVMPYLLLLCALSLQAATPDSLELETARRLALESHRDATRIRLLLRELGLLSQERRLQLLPRLDLNVTAPSIDDSRNEVWIGDSLQQLVWLDWNQRRESADLQLSAELPLATQAGLSSRAYHRDSDTQSFPEEYGNSWRAWITQDLIPRRTLHGDLQESGRELELLKLEALDELARFRHRVAEAYRDLLLAQGSLGLSRADLESSRLNLENAQGRFQAGLIAESEYLRVEVDALGRESSFVTDSVQVRRQEEDFARLTGLDLDRLPPLAGLGERRPIELGLDELKARLLADNTSILRQEQRRISLQRDRNQAKLDRLPELELSASWSWLREGDDWDWDPAQARLNRSLRLDFSWALFDRLEKRRALERSRIALRRADLDRDELLESLDAQLESLWNRRGELLRLQPLKERQTELAARDAEITLERFDAGLVQSQDLIDAERTLSASRLDRLRLAIDLARVDAELARITGLDREGLEEWIGEN